ncbi:MAG: shikimate dehydrogenase [Puniceicoccaceae bacterium]
MVHTLERLELAAPLGKRLVVLGDPISHSLSPAMHNAALAEMARQWPEFADWRYEAVHVPAVDLPRALPLLYKAGVAGINLTIPHKVQALGIIEEVDALSSRMGAVNTLVRTATGYRGTNTDGYGILKAIDESFQRTPAGADVWIFGAGGASRGIIVACLEAGADRVTVLNRSVARLEELEAVLVGGRVPGLEKVRFHSLQEAPVDAGEAAIFINATALGLKITDPSPVDAVYLKPGSVVYDTTYGCSNRLAEDCQEAGIAYSDGIPMLVWQGVRSLEIWSGKSVPAGAMRRAVDTELKRRKEDG